MIDISALSKASIAASPLSELAVVVVNYCTSSLAIEAVKSVLSQHHGGREVEVHVVDNASPDDSASVLRAAHSSNNWEGRVTLWLEDTNHGFGCGNNLVIDSLLSREVPPDAIFFLNPDALIENEVLDILAKRIEADPKLGFAGAATSLPDGERRTAAFRFPSIVGEFVRTVSLGPISQILGHYLVPLPPETPEGPVNWVTGAAFMVRAKALQALGGFDPDFFLYYEEVELMQRGAQAGWGCRYVPEARVIHIEGESTNVKSKRTERKRAPSYVYVSWRLYFTKTYGRTGAVLAGIACLTGAALNHLLCWLRQKKPAAAPYFFRDFWQHAMRPLLMGSQNPDNKA